MTQGLAELQRSTMTAELRRLLLPRLSSTIRSRGPGHCMYVTDIDNDLMVDLCRGLREQAPGAQSYILGSQEDVAAAGDLFATSTKIVELRNPTADQTLRPPLLVFLPNNLRTNAEDSFNIATFEHIPVKEDYDRAAALLLQEVPSALRGLITEVLQLLKTHRWPWADSLHVIRFLLTIKNNDYDPEAAGGALFELGLVPDFVLMTDTSRVRYRVERNLDAVKTLTFSGKSERGRVVELRLRDQAFRKRLSEFLVETGLEDPRGWTRRIVADPANWPLNFGKWEFEDGDSVPEEVFIRVIKTTLPYVEDTEASANLQELVGSQVLPLGDPNFKKFSVEFEINPRPATVQGLAKFVVQLISKESGPVGVKKTKSVTTNMGNRASVNFTSLHNMELEEGWHYIRVLPLTADGDLIRLVDEAGAPLPWSDIGEDMIRARRPNESDLFYVLPGGEVDVEPFQRSIPRAQSLEHARLDYEFSAVRSGRDPGASGPEVLGWKKQPTTRRAALTDFIEVRFGLAGTVHIPVSHALKNLEGGILGQPEGALNWLLPVRMGVAGEPVAGSHEWPSGQSIKDFIEARKRYFAAIKSVSGDLISQVADFRALKHQITEYVRSYEEVIKGLLRSAGVSSGRELQKIISDLRNMVALDSILVRITNHRGDTREAGIVGPTHPLQALWLAAWAELVAEWLRKAKEAPPEYLEPARKSLSEKLTPLNFPPVMPFGRSRLFMAVDTLHPFWTLYAPASEDDPRGLIGEVSSCFGISETGIGGAVITGEYIAARIQRYLIQHPYVRTLTISAFNPGRAGVIRDALLELQRAPAFRDILYDVRLFVSDPGAPGVGEALAELLSPGSGLAAEEADAFSVPTGNHLFPKLSLAIRRIGAFREQPSAYKAHISILFDVFPPGEVGAAIAPEYEPQTPLHGLFQNFSVSYQDDREGVVWRRQPAHGVAQPLLEAEELTDLLVSLPKALSSATAAIATGETGLNTRPVISLALDTADRTLIHQVHEASDWVFTIDRNMGIEYFDHGGRQGRPDYLIDHSPDMSSSLGHRLVITSRSLAEIEAMLRPALEKYALAADSAHAAAVLNQLRSLSGRLALKFISSPNQRAEALGLALSRLYLEYNGVLTNQIIVPLDAHLDLYRSLPNSVEESSGDTNFKRTDLALFDLNANARTITCNLVEVKCYTQVGGLGAYQQLRESIAEQVNQSERVLRAHFDPRRTAIDRPDRLVKTLELSALLDFYLGRGVRYGLVPEDVHDEARFFLTTLEEGYDLKFTKSAIIFDFEKPGTDPPEIEGEVEYHRVGIDVIRGLMEVAARHHVLTQAGEGMTLDVGQVLQESVSVQQLAKEGAIPQVTEANFVIPHRDRSVSWDVIRARRVLGDDTFQPVPVATPTLDSPPAEPLRDAEVVSANREATPMPEPKEVPLIVVAGEQGEGLPQTDESISADEAVVQDAGRPIGGVPEVSYDVLLGSNTESPQFGTLGEVSGRRVALDLNQTHTISLFGVQGGGKSYTLGTIIEMASMPIPGINRLPRPLATVVFHYSPTQDYQPEFTSMISPNPEADQLTRLKERFGAGPQSLSDVVLLAPTDKVELRRQEFPGIEVHPLAFSASELQAAHWRFLMGAVGSQSMYIRQVNMIMRTLRNNLTLQGIREGIDRSTLSDNLKELAHTRLELAAQYIDDGVNLTGLIKPGRLIIVDMRDEFIVKDEALGLFVVLLQLFSEAKYEGESFNKLVVFDEAHKYIESQELVAGLVEVVREMRHKGTSILVASQDPPSVPVSLIELSSQIILHKFNSPAWLRHVQKANAALNGLTPEKMAHLGAGEAYVWSSKATDDVFSKGAVKVLCRPRVTRHGGATRTALS